MQSIIQKIAVYKKNIFNILYEALFYILLIVFILPFIKWECGGYQPDRP